MLVSILSIRISIWVTDNASIFHKNWNCGGVYGAMEEDDK